jgi:hypothetical protein
MTQTIPLKIVRGYDEVTVWMWPGSPDPVTVRFSLHEWAKIEWKAERVADGDVEKEFGTLVEKDLESVY